MSATEPPTKAVVEAPDETEVRADGASSAPSVKGYRALWRLGTGASGEVWAVERTPAGPIRPPLALKRLHPALAADRALVARFVSEMRLASRISHPNVCRVLDGDVEDGVPYFVMELVLGLSLSEIQEHLAATTSATLRERWSGVLVHVLAEVSEGLHAAHEARDEDGTPLKLVHRDVSPDNVLVCFDGTVRVIDFGIAAARRARERTATGELHAKLAFASPEQIDSASARGAPVDRRTDVWALGVMLWEGLAGRALFERTTLLETAEAIRRGIVPPIREHVPSVPASLEEIAAGALTRDPERRFQTARAMGKELRVALVETGGPGAAEVAEWMAELLPGVEPRLRRLTTRRPSTDVADATLSAHPAPRPWPALLFVALLAFVAGALVALLAQP